MYIVIEGQDGTGKSTQVQLLKEYFEKAGRTVVVMDEPDGTGWSSEPYTKEQAKWKKERVRDDTIAEKIIAFVEKYNLKLVYVHQRITEGTSTLSKSNQQWFKEHFLPGVTGRGRGTTIIPG